VTFGLGNRGGNLTTTNVSQLTMNLTPITSCALLVKLGKVPLEGQPYLTGGWFTSCLPLLEGRLMRSKLTAITVAQFKPTTERREITDAHAPWLRLRIQPKPSGTKSWVMRFRGPDGRASILTLGRVDLSGKEAADEPVLGGVLTLGQARELAARINRERARGIDVVEEYKARKLRERAEHQDRAQNTFGVLVAEFFRDYKTRWGARPRRWRGDAALLGLRWPQDSDPTKSEPTVVRGSLADTWRDKPVVTIDGHDVHIVVDQARKTGSESRARKVHAALSVFFRWALQRQKVASNPCNGVWRPGAPPARDRVLSDSEIGLFWQATTEVAEPFRGTLKLLLLTGARLSEIAGMRRDELHADGTWHVPASRTKNHRPNVLPLPPLAQQIIAGVPHIEGNNLIFTTNGRTPISGWSKIKRSLDAAMGPKVPHWRLHDLRRTAASGMSRLGVRSEVIERALNHISGSFRGVAGTYQRDPLSEEVRAAMLRWSQHVTDWPLLSQPKL
jgi:integrase